MTGAGDVEAVYRRLLDAWNAGDGEGRASCFADDGEMLGCDGSFVGGRDDIGRAMSAIFADHDTAAYVAKVRSVRSLAEGVVVLRAIAGMVPAGGDDLNPAVNTHHTVVARTAGDEWAIALFQNTPAQFHGRPELTEAFTEELRDLL